MKAAMLTWGAFGLVAFFSVLSKLWADSAFCFKLVTAVSA